MWSGRQDIVTIPKDLKNLEAKVSNFIYCEKILHYNHLYFVLELDVYNQIYTEIIAIINEAQ